MIQSLRLSRVKTDRSAGRIKKTSDGTVVMRSPAGFQTSGTPMCEATSKNVYMIHFFSTPECPVIREPFTHNR